MKNKKIFEESVINVIKFAAQDIIATSGENYDVEKKNIPITQDFDVFG